MTHRRAGRPASIVSILALVCLVCGVPAVLILSGGVPDRLGIIHVILHPSTIANDLRSPATNLALLHIFVAVAWLGWLWFIACILAEVIARIAHRPVSKIPGSRRMQSVAACLVGVSLGLMLLARVESSPSSIRLHALQPADAVCLFQDGAAGHGMQGVQNVAHSQASQASQASQVSQDVQDSQASQASQDVQGVPRYGVHGGARATAVNNTIEAKSAGPKRTRRIISGKIIKAAGSYVSRTRFDGSGHSGTSTVTSSFPYGPGLESQKINASNTVSNAKLCSESNGDGLVGTGGDPSSLQGGYADGLMALAANTQGEPGKPPVSMSESDLMYSVGDAGSDSNFDENIDLYTVQPGDSLWSIAQKELGSGIRWKEIASLNDGRSEPGGYVFGESGWLLPGWEIELPGRHQPVNGYRPLVLTTVAPVSTGAGVVQDGAPLLADGQVRSDGPALTEPPARVPAVPSLPAGGVGLGTLGAGVLFAVDRRRLVQGRYRGAGRGIKLPSGDLLDFERRLRISVDADAIDWVRTGISVVASVAFKEYQRLCTPCALRLRPEMLDVAVDGDVEMVSPPFRPLAMDNATGGMSASLDPLSMKLKWWALDRSENARRQLINDPWYGQVRDIDVAMATLGRDTEGVVMADLDTLASLCLSIEPDKCILLLNSLAVELATSPWVRNSQVIAVGLPKIAGLNGRIEEAESLPLLMPRLARRVSQSSKVLGGPGQDTARQGVEGAQGMSRTIVLVASEEAAKHPESAIALASLVSDGSSGLLAAIGGIVPNAKSVLHRMPGSDLLTLTVGDAVIVLQDTAMLADDDAMNIKSLLEVAQDNEGYSTISADQWNAPSLRKGAREEVQPVDGTQPASGLPATTFTACTPPVQPVDGTQPASGGVEVCMLGQVEIHGAERAFARAWAVDLVVYLAMHPRGASSDQWASALWPDKLMAPSSLHSTASAARRALGKSPDGLDYLPRSHGKLALRSTVRSDMSRLMEMSKSLHPADWKSALELVRGRPFEGLRSTDWALLEGIYAYVESEVVDLAAKYAEHCLEVGDVPGAEWAARRGLLVSAYDERLYRILMRSADLAGNPAGVERVMRELVHLVAEDLEPYDAVHPETVELYRLLSRRQSLLAMA
ncbi:MAG: LysM peptidoglycan-binding domain-containing protein [Acidimicrobiales bacterium]